MEKIISYNSVHNDPKDESESHVIPEMDWMFSMPDDTVNDDSSVAPV